MKRVIAFILILSLCLSLAACGGTGNKTDNYTELTLVASQPDDRNAAQSGNQEYVISAGHNGSDWVFFMDLVNSTNDTLTLEAVTITEYIDDRENGFISYEGQTLNMLPFVERVLEPGEIFTWDDMLPLDTAINRMEYRHIFRDSQGQEFQIVYRFEMNGDAPAADGQAAPQQPAPAPTQTPTEPQQPAPAPTQTPTEPPIDPFAVDDGLVDSTNDIVIDFYEFLDQKNAEHKAVLDTTYSDKWYKQYTPDFHDTLDLVSKEEAEKLLSCDMSSPEAWCSKDDALKDVDLLFRVLKSFYGPYYYFGGEEAFDAAEERILAEIENKPEKFTIAEFAECIAKKLDFVLDRHFGVGENNNLCDINNITVYDFYVKDLYFYQDDVGYFTKINDRKWYIQQVGTDANFLDYFQITVDGKGQLCYCLLLCEPKTGLHTSIHDITLSRGERSVTLPIAWKMYLQRANLDLKISEKISTKDNIPLLRVRFGSSTSGTDYDDQAQRLRVMGRDFLSQDVFIYDFVSGSGCQALFDSIRHQNVELSLYRFSNLASDLGRWNMPWDIAGRGEYGVRYFKGVWGKNDTLTFTVQDKTNFSAASLSIANIRAIENSLTIGGSTGGSVGPGGATNQSMVLYNTGMLVEFGATLQIVAGYTEDGYCIEPDIWYEPREAAEAAYRICEFYGIENTVDTSTLAQYNYGRLW